MWTYLRGVKIESSLATADGSPLVLSETNKDHGFGPMQNSFSGPSGDSSLSTQSTDNSSGSLLNSKKRSATLSHNKNSPRLKADYECSESGGAFLSSSTMFGRRPRDQVTAFSYRPHSYRVTFEKIQSLFWPKMRPLTQDTQVLEKIHRFWGLIWAFLTPIGTKLAPNWCLINISLAPILSVSKWMIYFSLEDYEVE